MRRTRVKGAHVPHTDLPPKWHARNQRPPGKQITKFIGRNVFHEREEVFSVGAGGSVEALCANPRNRKTPFTPEYSPTDTRRRRRRTKRRKKRWRRLK